ncbi:MAG TPA: hypothetical protein VFD36_29325 [Kofleriaceae bacterium]|nr:hypothetical protein [Kofleriaceae bacterium]
MPRRCVRHVMADGTVALLTVDVPPPKPCAFCGTLCESLCDFPLRGKKAGRTCSKRICDKCKRTVGKDLDLCPIHDKYVRDHGLEARLVPLLEGDDKSHQGHAVALDLVDQHGQPETPQLRARSPAEYQELFTERAAIYEYLGEIPREEAERRARADIERPRA